MARGLIPYDRRALGGCAWLAGIDEAGRGCLAGPVAAAAVRIDAAFYRSSWCRRHCRDVDDSKRLSPARGAGIVAWFREARHENWLQIGIGSASVGEIGRFNILQATALAMRRAFEAALGGACAETLWSAPGGPGPAVGVVLIDGRPVPSFPSPHQAVVKGDQRSLAIALAGIHAKEWRDARMRELDAIHPGYGFGTHKGYGTAEHLDALRRLGPTPEHRTLFLRKFRSRLGDPGPGEGGPEASQGSLF
jgi:ribonuclease HII